jgi:hypothetical protein
MDAQTQRGFNFGDWTKGYEMMQSMQNQWMESMNRLFPVYALEEAKNKAPGMEIFKTWMQMQENFAGKQKPSVPDLQAMATACIEHQKRCSELSMAWWKCYINAYKAIGAGLRNGDQVTQIFKTCMDLSDEYLRSCTDFLNAQSETLMFLRAPGESTAEDGTAKAKPAKAKAS